MTSDSVTFTCPSPKKTFSSPLPPLPSSPPCSFGGNILPPALHTERLMSRLILSPTKYRSWCPSCILRRTSGIGSCQSRISSGFGPCTHRIWARWILDPAQVQSAHPSVPCSPDTPSTRPLHKIQSPHSRDCGFITTLGIRTFVAVSRPHRLNII